MDVRRRHMSIESILVMFLMIVFAVSSCVMIIQGSNSYKGIISQKAKQENARIAISYINMRVKQSDISGKIKYIENAVEGNNAIVIYHSGEESGYMTYIYSDKGTLYECYTDEGTIPTMNTSSVIVHLDYYDMIYNENTQMIQVTIKYNEGDNEQSLTNFVSLRTDSL